jgi:putative flippase GtrA
MVTHRLAFKDGTVSMFEQVYKFALVGGISTLINYGTFYFFFKILGWNYLLSSSLGYLLGVVLGFIFNKRWTFRSKSKLKREMVSYFILYTCTLFLSMLVLKLQVEILKVQPLLANLFTIILTTIINFIGTKFFVFKGKEGTK